MRRYIEVPIQLLDIEGDGFHIMVKGTIHGKEARFLIDTGASRSVFDPLTLSKFIDDIQYEKKVGMTAGVGSSDLDSSTFIIGRWTIGELEITDYEGVALDLDNIHQMYQKIHLPHIDGIIGGDVLKKYKAVINYRSKKLRLTPSSPLPLSRILHRGTT